MKKNNIGAISLSISIIGMLALMVGFKFGYLHHFAWELLLAGFEAAVVGGCADWFAVRALFVEIPIPFVKKHTNIIVKSRKKLSDGIVDLVSNQWLSKESITDKLSAVNLGAKTIEMAAKPENQTKIISFIQKTSIRILQTTSFSDFTPQLEQILKKEIASLEVATPLGKWMQQKINQKEHFELWEMSLNTIKNTVNTPKTRKILLQTVEKQANLLKQESTLKNLLVSGAQVFGGFDNNTVVDKLITAINTFVTEAKQDENHPVRQKIDQQLLQFSEDLVEGKPKAVQFVANMQTNIINHIDANNIIDKLLNGLQSTLLTQLNQADSALIGYLKKQLLQFLMQLEADTKSINKLDHFLKNTLVTLIDKNHHLIAHTVADSLSKLKDEDLVAQIEEKVGNDLQYIRLNGALVGGFVGMILFLIKHLLA